MLSDMKYLLISTAVCVIALLPAACTGPQFTSLEERFDVVSINDFAFLVCLSSSYRTGGYPLWAKELDSQAWNFMNNNRTPNYIVFKVYKYSGEIGRRVAIKDAPKQCSRWRNSWTLKSLYTDF